MSEIKVNSIKGVGASAAAITVNNTDGTCTANITNNLSNRNLIINGAMQVAQRGTSSTSGGYQTVDRFGVYHDGTDEAPTQAQVDVASGTTPYTLGFRKALKVTNGNQTSGAGADDYIWIQQNLEAQDIANSGWNYVSTSSYVTLSFWVKSSVAQDFKCYLRTRDGTERQYPFATGSLTADTWTKVTKTISGNSGLTFDNNVNQGLQINIGCFFGTNLTASGVTENAWGSWASTARVPDMTSTWYTTNDATFEITGMQLEVGSVATDFEHRSFAQELALCQRYFTKVAYAQASGSGDGTTMASVHARFGVDMRAGPTITASGVLNAQGDNALNSTQSSAHVGTSNFSSTQNMYLVFVQNFSGVVQGRSYVIGLIANNSNQFLADAEL